MRVGLGFINTETIDIELLDDLHNAKIVCVNITDVPVEYIEGIDNFLKFTNLVLRRGAISSRGSPKP